jgi:hypothetical protein
MRRTVSKRKKKPMIKRQPAPPPVVLTDPTPIKFGPDGMATFTVLSDFMAPRFDVGEMIVVQDTPARIGDHAFIQYRQGGMYPADHTSLVRLIDRTPNWLKIKLYNPQWTYDVAAKDVARVYRVMTVEDVFKRQ